VPYLQKAKLKSADHWCDNAPYPNVQKVVRYFAHSTTTSWFLPKLLTIILKIILTARSPQKQKAKITLQNYR